MLSKSIPTKEECDLIVAANSAFFCKEWVVDGFEACQYSYLLANRADFFKPLPYSYMTGFELRGITFIKNENGVWERFLSIPKFFNLNETAGSMKSDFEDDEIESIMDKRDGSAILCVRLPNKKLVAKTQMAFESPQAVAATRIINNSESYKRFIHHCFDRGLYPNFEFTSDTNLVVLEYFETELKLLGVRQEDGQYLTEKELKKLATEFDVPIVDFIKFKSIDDITTWAGKTKDEEGVVVRMKSGRQFKVKTNWYCDLHGLITDNIYRPHKASEIILNNRFDDVIGKVPPSLTKARAYLESLNHFITSTVNEMVAETVRLTLETHSAPSRKEFYETNRLFILITTVMRSYGKEPDIEHIKSLVVNTIRHETWSQERASKWLKESGFTDFL